MPDSTHQPAEPPSGFAAPAHRYAAARAALNSAARMEAMRRFVACVRPAAAPCVVLLGASPRQLSHARRVGLFPGSFNPLTLAHVALADAARAAADLDLVIWAIAAHTVDKEQVQRATLEDRVAQMAAFTALAASTSSATALALTNRGLYVDQARAMRARLPTAAELYIIIGYDKIVQIFDPRYYADRTSALDALFAQARVLVGPRDGLGADALRALLARPENAPYARAVTYVPLPAAIARDSSTTARSLASTAGPERAQLRQLVPPEALALIGSGAYSPTSAGEERYALRQEWLRALRALPPRDLRNLPPVAWLVRHSAATTPHAQALRAWLRADGADRAATAAGRAHALMALLRAPGALADAGWPAQ